MDKTKGTKVDHPVIVKLISRTRKVQDRLNVSFLGPQCFISVFFAKNHIYDRCIVLKPYWAGVSITFSYNSVNFDTFKKPYVTFSLFWTGE